MANSLIDKKTKHRSVAWRALVAGLKEARLHGGTFRAGEQDWRVHFTIPVGLDWEMLDRAGKTTLSPDDDAHPEDLLEMTGWVGATLRGSIREPWWTENPSEEFPSEPEIERRLTDYYSVGWRVATGSAGSDDLPGQTAEIHLTSTGEEIRAHVYGRIKPIELVLDAGMFGERRAGFPAEVAVRLPSGKRVSLYDWREILDELVAQFGKLAGIAGAGGPLGIAPFRLSTVNIAAAGKELGLGLQGAFDPDEFTESLDDYRGAKGVEFLKVSNRKDWGSLVDTAYNPRTDQDEPVKPNDRGLAAIKTALGTYRTGDAVVGQAMAFVTVPSPEKDGKHWEFGLPLGMIDPRVPLFKEVPEGARRRKRGNEPKPVRVNISPALFSDLFSFVLGQILAHFKEWADDPFDRKATFPAEALAHILWSNGNRPKDWDNVLWRGLYLVHETPLILRRTDQRKADIIKIIGPPGRDVTESGVIYRAKIDTKTLEMLVSISGRRLHVPFNPAHSAYVRFSPHLERQHIAMMSHVKGNLTHRRDGVAHFNHEHQPDEDPRSGRDYRIYTSNFCPLLPEGREYVAALGAFKSGNPENGWALFHRKNGYGASGGVIERWGFGRIKDRTPQKITDITRRFIREGLEPLVRMYWDGEIAFRRGDCPPEWLSLEQVALMGVGELEELRLYVFLSPNFEQREQEAFESASGWRVETDPAVIDAVASGSERPDLPTDAEEQPLPVRLRAWMRDTETSARALAAILGVNVSSVSKWLSGKKLISKKMKARIESLIAD